jgi:hypothetical protein
MVIEKIGPAGYELQRLKENIAQQDNIIPQLLTQMLKLGDAQATEKDMLFIKSTFPSFHFRNLKEWWPQSPSRGREGAQRGGDC